MQLAQRSSRAGAGSMSKMAMPDEFKIISPKGEFKVTPAHSSESKTAPMEFKTARSRPALSGSGLPKPRSATVAYSPRAPTPTSELSFAGGPHAPHDVSGTASIAGSLSAAPSGPYPGITPVPSQHERLLNEVEATDGQLGATLRAVYDAEEEAEAAFLESLGTRIRGHERDIERMCNKNYQGFIESVSELLKVKSDALKLRRKIQEANNVIQDTGQQLMRSAEELYHARQVQRNIVATIESVNLCIPVLEQYCKLKDQMEEKQYYSALKTLEQLEHTYLPRSKKYFFAELLAAEIPKLRASIENQSKEELTDFLASVREKSVMIGEVAMHQSHRHNSIEVAQDVIELLNPASPPDPDLCAQDLIDFSPVYRCLHIHSVLGKREVFVEDYRHQRRSQVRLAIKPHGIWKGEIGDYKRYFYGIVGFFVVEDTILHTTQGLIPHKSSEEESLVTRKIVHEFWDMALSEVSAVLRSNCGSCGNYYLLLKIKQLVVWFCHTVRAYGFVVDKLYEVLWEIRDQYDELLMKAWRDAFNQIFSSDDYNPIMVQTDDQYHGVLEVFPYQQDLELASAPFPKCFPFSGMVPQVFKQLRLFVGNCASYAAKLNLSQTEVDDCVRKSVNILLSRTLNGCLTKLITKESLTIPQLGQIWVNISHLEDSCGGLEKFISQTTKTDSEGITVSRLYGVSTLRDARQSCEQQMVSKLSAKLEEIMDGAAYDWTPKEPIKRPSDYLEDCLQFMETTLAAVQQLEVRLVSTITTKAVGTLAAYLESIILSDKFTRITREGIQSFEVDLRRCESFARSLVGRMDCLQQSSVPTAFSILRKLVELFIAGEWNAYVTEFSSPVNRKYDGLPAHMVHNVLLKMRQEEKRRRTKLATFRRPLRKKKDEKKMVLDRLKELLGSEGVDFEDSMDSVEHEA